MPITAVRRRTTRLLAATAALALTAAAATACASNTSSDAASAQQGSSSLSGVTLTLGDQVSALKTLLTASGELTGTAYTVKFAEFQGAAPLFQAVEEIGRAHV